MVVCHYWFFARYFNPRTPCGVRPLRRCAAPSPIKFQSTHPLRGATTYSGWVYSMPNISIHAPLAGCDEEMSEKALRRLAISIHAPLAGCDTAPSKRRKTRKNFNPRTPCGVRPYPSGLFSHTHAISIHAPLAGCDAFRSIIFSDVNHFNPRTPRGVRRACRSCSIRCSGFQSTHPWRGATRLRVVFSALLGISIHAPLAGCDRLRIRF